LRTTHRQRIHDLLELAIQLALAGLSARILLGLAHLLDRVEQRRREQRGGVLVQRREHVPYSTHKRRNRHRCCQQRVKTRRETHYLRCVRRRRAR
jgi:hypothetical protein